MRCRKKKRAFTLVEMLIVIAIILSLAALAAAFFPRVNDRQNLSRSVDSLQQWLLTAKMRAKRDGLTTGLRFIHQANDPAGACSQCQYVQQPEPLTGGVMAGPPSPLPPAVLPPGFASPYQYPAVTGNWYCGGLLVSAGVTPDGTNAPAPGQVFLRLAVSIFRLAIRPTPRICGLCKQGIIWKLTVAASMSLPLRQALRL